MAGHSKWANIKHRKAAVDAKKGKLFTKLAREIETAARLGGGDPSVNFTLRMVLEKAKQANMPKENIERAIKRGTGELQGEALEEVWYEGYGPGGAALMIKCLTDNRNRAVGEVRSTLRKHGGSLGEGGSVAWQFEEKGIILIPLNGQDAEELMLQAIDAGAEDVDEDNNYLEVVTGRADLQKVREALDAQQVHIESAELKMIPKTYLDLDRETQLSVAKLIEALEDLDDVQAVYTNVRFSDEVLEQLAA